MSGFGIGPPHGKCVNQLIEFNIYRYKYWYFYRVGHRYVSCNLPVYL